MEEKRQFACINGVIFPRERSSLSIENAGLQYGYGLFETLRTYRGVFFAWEKHYQRLEKGCRMLHMKIPFSSAEGLEMLSDLHRHFQQEGYREDGVYRLTITPEMIRNWQISDSSTSIITRREIPDGLEQMQQSGIDTALLETKRLPSITVERTKSIHFTDMIFGRLEMNRYGANILEGLMLDDDGKIVEATCSNLFALFIDKKKGMTLVTPPKEDGPLLGITREIVIMLAERLQLTVEERSLRPEMLTNAKELFLTNSVQELVPIKRLFSKGQLLYHNTQQDYMIANRLLASYKQYVYDSAYEPQNSERKQL